MNSSLFPYLSSVVHTASFLNNIYYCYYYLIAQIRASTILVKNEPLREERLNFSIGIDSKCK